jgi:hypothetical protein
VIFYLSSIDYHFYFSQEMPRSSFNVELDAANATWLVNDVALLSTKTGELLLLTLIYDGRYVAPPFSFPLFIVDLMSILAD